jgi:hypothetical protein
MAKILEHIQVFIDGSRWFEWIIRRISVIALVLMAISILLNLGRADLLSQIAVAMLVLLLMNAMATGMRRLAETFQGS